MKRQTKQRLAVAAAMVMLTSLTACSGEAQGPGPAEDISLRMLTWTTNPDQLAVFEEVANAFMAEHPEVVEISFESTAAADMPTVLTTQLRAGDPPDISWLAIEDSRYFIG